MARACALIFTTPRKRRRFWIWWTRSSSASWRWWARALPAFDFASDLDIFFGARRVAARGFGLGAGKVGVRLVGHESHRLIEVRHGQLMLVELLVGGGALEVVIEIRLQLHRPREIGESLLEIARGPQRRGPQIIGPAQ